MENINFRIDGNITQNNLNGNNKIKVSGKIIKKDDPETITETKTEPKVKNARFCNNWFLWGLVIIILDAILFFMIPIIQDNYVGGILAFVGILATFIVVSNYAQVKEIENKFYKRENELDQKINNQIKDTECKVSSFIYCKDAVKHENEARDIDAFYSYVYALASWHDANQIDINMINTILSKIISIIEKISVEKVVSESITIDSYALNCCSSTLGRNIITNSQKQIIINFIKELKEKGGSKISYEYNLEF
jgi:hypothetical protein